jgi:hypothetical protein
MFGGMVGTPADDYTLPSAGAPSDDDRHLTDLWDFPEVPAEDFGDFAESSYDPDEPVDLYGPDEYQEYPSW